MARTSPVHSGYTILHGRGLGSNGHRIDVWVEYQLGQQSLSENYTPVEAWFYAALNPGYTSTTAYSSGLNSSFSPGQGVADQAYDFTSADRVNLLGSYRGNIVHDANGAGQVTFSGSFTTLSTYISGGEISATVILPAIPRCAAVTAEDGVLGGNCCVSFTPARESHSFRLAFSLGDWSAETPLILPNTTAPVTYRDTVLPFAVATGFPGSSDVMTVTLTTYENGVALGSSTAQFTVTLPQNEATVPVITATLRPVCQAFPQLYLQHLGRIQAEATATDPYGAAITDWSITVGDATVTGLTSDFIPGSGVQTVTVRATSTRGFTGTWTGQIKVQPYESPRLQADCYRCLSDGSRDQGGTYLAVDAVCSVSPVSGANTGLLQYRLKPSGGEYGPWQPVSTVILPGVVLQKELAYTLQLRLSDTAGSSLEQTFSVPVEQVYMHKTANALALGGYAGRDNTLEVYWDILGHSTVNGAHIRTLTPEGNRLVLKGVGTVLLLGGGIWGVLTSQNFTGSQGVTATFGEQITLTLPQADSPLVLISPDPIEI